MCYKRRNFRWWKISCVDFQNLSLTELMLVFAKHLDIEKVGNCKKKKSPWKWIRANVNARIAWIFRRLYLAYVKSHGNPAPIMPNIKIKWKKIWYGALISYIFQCYETFEIKFHTNFFFFANTVIKVKEHNDLSGESPLVFCEFDHSWWLASWLGHHVRQGLHRRAPAQILHIAKEELGWIGSTSNVSPFGFIRDRSLSVKSPGSAAHSLMDGNGLNHKNTCWWPSWAKTVMTRTATPWKSTLDTHQPKKKKRWTATWPTFFTVLVSVDLTTADCLDVPRSKRMRAYGSLHQTKQYKHA